MEHTNYSVCGVAQSVCTQKLHPPPVSRTLKDVLLPDIAGDRCKKDGSPDFWLP